MCSKSVVSALVIFTFSITTAALSLSELRVYSEHMCEQFSQATSNGWTFQVHNFSCVQSVKKKEPVNESLGQLENGKMMTKQFHENVTGYEEPMDDMPHNVNRSDQNDNHRGFSYSGNRSFRDNRGLRDNWYRPRRPRARGDRVPGGWAPPVTFPPLRV